MVGLRLSAAAAAAAAVVALLPIAWPATRRHNLSSRVLTAVAHAESLTSVFFCRRRRRRSVLRACVCRRCPPAHHTEFVPRSTQSVCIGARRRVLWTPPESHNGRERLRTRNSARTVFPSCTRFNRFECASVVGKYRRRCRPRQTTTTCKDLRSGLVPGK